MAKFHKTIKVLLTIPNFDTAGSGKALLKIAKGLNPADFQVHIACFHNRGAFFETVKNSGLPIHLIPLTHPMRPIVAGLWHCWKISRYLKSQQFDVIHSYHYSADYSEGLAARMAGIPWVFTKKNMNWGGSAQNSWKLRSYLAHRIAVQNTDMVAQFYPKSTKVYHLTRGVDTREFHQRPPSERLLKEFNLDPTQQVVVCVANMVPIKGIDVLIHAFHRLALEGTVLMLVGEDQNDYGRQLRDLVQDLNLTDRVIFTGKRFEIAEFLSIATVFVLPTLNKGRKEGSPVSLLEAMASGVPVLGTRIPGIRDQLKEFPELMFEPDCTNQLTEKLHEMLSLSDQTRRELSEALVKHVNQKYTLEQEIARHAELYSNCLSV